MRVSRIAHVIHLLCCLVLMGTGMWTFLCAAARALPWLHLIWQYVPVLQALCMMPTYEVRGWSWFKRSPTGGERFWQWSYHYPYNNPLETVAMLVFFVCGTAFQLMLMLSVHWHPTTSGDLSDGGYWIVLAFASIIFWWPRLMVFICGHDEIKPPVKG